MYTQRWSALDHEVCTFAPVLCPDRLCPVMQVVLGFVCEADFKLVAKAIRDRVTAIKRQREKLRRQAVEQKKKLEQEAIEEEPEPQPPSPKVTEPVTPESPIPTPAPTPVLSPVTSSADSGVSSSFPPEAEEPEADQHFQIHHNNSCSSANCEQLYLHAISLYLSGTL